MDGGRKRRGGNRGGGAIVTSTYSDLIFLSHCFYLEAKLSYILNIHILKLKMCGGCGAGAG
jgi:hypothetical protein